MSLFVAFTRCREHGTEVISLESVDKSILLTADPCPLNCPRLSVMRRLTEEIVGEIEEMVESVRRKNQRARHDELEQEKP
jgi:hypothetical protein